jgi:hypothetical protein
MLQLLENESFNINKLIRHMRTKRSSLADSGAEFFKRYAETVKETRFDICGS